MPSTSESVRAAAVARDPARAMIVAALMDGRALCLAELARAARISAQTATEQVAALTEAGILTPIRQSGRSYYRLAPAGVASVLDGFGVHPRTVRTGPRDRVLRYARTCYGHLAGAIGVAITDRMIARGEIALSENEGVLTERGAVRLSELGVDLAAAHQRDGRAFCRSCLDWSERRPHLGGSLGRAMCETWLRRDWMCRVERTRAVTLTAAGAKALGDAFDLDLATPEIAATPSAQPACSSSARSGRSGSRIERSRSAIQAR